MKYLIKHWKGELSLTKSFWINFVLFSVIINVIPALLESNIQKYYGLFITEPYSLIISFFILLIIISLIIFTWQVIGTWRCCLNYITRGKKVKSLIVMVIIELNVLILILLIISVYKINKVITNKEKNKEYSIKIVDNNTKIHLVGDIKFGVSKDLKNILKTNLNITGIIIDSYGGFAIEGFKIAKLIEINELNTYVSSICASAGTIAFIAGKERYIDPKAILGFHHPYSIIDYPQVFNLTQIDIFLLKKPNDSIEEYYLQHISKSGVAKDFIEKLRNHQSIDLLYFSTEELVKSGFIHGTKDIVSISDLGFEYKNKIEAIKLNNNAMQLDRDGNQKEAIRLVSEVTELMSDKANLYFNRAVYYKKLQQYEPMIQDLTKAIELYRDSDDFEIKQYVRILDYRNFAYSKLKMHEKALNDINLLIQIDSLNAEYLFKRADTYFILDSLSLSLKDYNKSISIDSTRVECYFGKAINYYHLKQYTESLDAVSTFLECNNSSRNFVGYYLRGGALIELKMYKKAKLDFENYIKYESQDAAAYLLLAIAHYKLNDLESANDCFNKADSLKTPEDISWELYDGIIYYSTNIKSILKELGKL